jgi:hypothetical protein
MESLDAGAQEKPGSTPCCTAMIVRSPGDRNGASSTLTAGSRRGPGGGVSWAL